MATTFEDAAERVAGVAGAVDRGAHRSAAAASAQRTSDARLLEAGRRQSAIRWHRVRRRDLADLDDMAEDVDAERGEELPADAADGHARGGLARARALETSRRSR